MSDETARSLRIKTGTLRRLRKELTMYKEDETKELKRVEVLRAKSADPHDIKYAENLLAEARTMVPDAEGRLDTAVADITRLLDETSDDASYADQRKVAEEELSAARKLRA